MVLVDVRAEGLFVLGGQRVEVRLVFQKFDNALLDVCVGKELFDRHLFRGITMGKWLGLILVFKLCS